MKQLLGTITVQSEYDSIMCHKSFPLKTIIWQYDKVKDFFLKKERKEE